ncbi:helix-turn-helix domain-containing protein [Desertibacillus haloalkaliphilus]|uniref:helix-turn-helix domain-containing protein n=1 Tax=Desertibacillus haloalkaliphilus TaxID=1328930 RepID=UPI001C252BB6|nr:helix-turn-helix domain-containing protein [Desertibacillus haloalkaliphilus]MBU8908303.1 helix-turn-helix domain-containing protein [Desertibacillus haloalkaliphilus]
MTSITKQEKLKQRIDYHLREVTRQLVKFDTVEETLNFLLESFALEFTCDLVAVILKEGDILTPKVWIGEDYNIKDTLTLPLDRCSPNLLQDALWWPNDKEDNSECQFSRSLENEEISTWFTVPLKENNHSFGFCLICFRKFVPLVLEAEKIFEEFGRDVAVAMELARKKEKQKKKIKGIEWLRENIFPGSSIEQMIEKIVERAGKGTKAKGACIFLYDENNNRFSFHQPAYGSIEPPKSIVIDSRKSMKNYFPSLETAGGCELTVPLVVNLKTIGVLHVCGKDDGTFTEEDLELLNFLASHVSTQIENARMYKLESESKTRMKSIIIHHQELSQKMVEGKSINELTETISSLLQSSIYLLDRFLRPISYYPQEEDKDLHSLIINRLSIHKDQILALKTDELWIGEDKLELGIWPVISSGDVLGYLAIVTNQKKFDQIHRLTLDYVLNIYAIEFMKEKLILETKEQVKESFINQLFAPSIDDYDKIIQYANLINWNLFDRHRITVLTIVNNQDVEIDLVELERKKAFIWDKIKTNMSNFDPGTIFTRKGNEFIFISHVQNEKADVNNYWSNVYRRIKQIVKKEDDLFDVYMGVGGITELIDEYYPCYKKASKATNVVYHRFSTLGFALYDDLGSYAILHSINDQDTVYDFVNEYLTPLLNYADGQGADLFLTLKTYLDRNGSIKETSEALFIHRSTLQYRLEKIREVLKVDLDDADVRFNLMMAYRLYSLSDKPQKLDRGSPPSFNYQKS